MSGGDPIYSWFPSMSIDWQNEAACRFSDVDTFMAEHNSVLTEKALSVCQACRVIDRCLEYALNLPSPYGVWGGLTGPQLRAEKRKTPPPIRHGTETGYKQHLYRKEPACSLCRAAASEAVRVRQLNLRWEHDESDL
jgi:WhiB family redox-sensing transcriptional regulator